MRDGELEGDGELEEAGEQIRQNIDAHVGRQIRLRRFQLDISQHKLGKMLGITFQQVGKYETGINRVSASRLYDLSMVLEVKVDFFFENMGLIALENNQPNILTLAEVYRSDRVRESFVDNKLNDHETSDLVRAYYRIKDSSTRRRILALIKSLHADDPELSG